MSAVDFDFDPCILDEARFFDPETKEWGFAVICVNPTHKGPEPCPDEREMFRVPGECPDCAGTGRACQRCIEDATGTGTSVGCFVAHGGGPCLSCQDTTKDATKRKKEQ